MKFDSLSSAIAGNSAFIVIDSNLLLLLILGSFDENLIGTFKRLAMFTVDDFHELQRLVSKFRAIRVTPHILTEVSNLANSLPEREKRSWAEYFRKWILDELQEQQVPAVQLVKSESFLHFGITDAALAEASRDTFIVTVDNRLASYLQRQNLRVLNFNHLRRPWLVQ